MTNFIDVIFNSIPEIIGGLVVAIILYSAALISSRLRQRKGSSGHSQQQIGDADETVSEPSESVAILPPRKHLVGRKNEKQRIIEGLKSNYSCITIQGRPGIGKTALAREIAWIIKKNSTVENATPRFEVILWSEDQQGNLKLNELLDLLADALGVDTAIDLPLNLKTLAVRKQLQNRSCLLIIDNFDTVADQEVVNFVQQMPAPVSKALVTSCKKVLKNECWVINLENLDFDDSRSLAKNEAKRLGSQYELRNQLLDENSNLLSDLCRVTEGDPYSIRIKVAQILAGIPLQDVLHPRLEDDGRLQLSWDLLHDKPMAQNVLLTIALFQVPPSIQDIEVVSGVYDEQLLEAINQIDDLLLLDVSGAIDEKHFGLHSRTKSFLSDRLLVENEQNRNLQSRLAEWVELYVQKNGGFKNWDGYQKIDQQYGTIMSTVHWCSQQESTLEKKRVIAIWRNIDHYMSVKGNMDDYVVLGKTVVECANSLGDFQAKTDAEVEILGFAYLTKGQQPQLSQEERFNYLLKAETLILAGINIYNEQGEWAKAGTANRYLGMIGLARRDHQSAKEYFEKSLGNFQSVSGWDNLGAVLSSLGNLARQQDDMKAAIEYQSRRFALAEALNNPEGMAVSSYNLGRLAQIQTNNAQAIELFKQALKSAFRSSRSDIIAASQWRLAECLFIEGDSVSALQYARDSNEENSCMGVTNNELELLISKLDAATKTPLSLSKRASLFFSDRFPKRFHRQRS